MNLLGHFVGWSLLILGAAWLFSDPDRNSGEMYAVPWTDPVANPAEPFPAIDPLAWTFDYDKIEKEILQLNCGKSGLKQISDSMEGILRRAIEHFPQQTNQDVLQRIQFLVSKNCPANAQVNLPDLLLQYFRYNQSLNAMREQQAGAGERLSAKETFKQTQALRVQVFGKENAKKLFGRQQIFANYLFERQRIMSDKGLTDAQKKAELNKLKQSFKESGAEPAGAK